MIKIVTELNNMKNKEIKDLLMQSLILDEAHVTSNGSHFQVIVIGDIFSTMARVEKQQMVYAPLTKYITDNSIHALSIRAYTPKEWQQYLKLNKF